VPPSGVVELVAPEQHHAAGLALVVDVCRDRTSCSRVENSDYATAIEARSDLAPWTAGYRVSPYRGGQNRERGRSIHGRCGK